MARTEDTAGNVTYTIPNCDCGLTGGCEKCQPIIIRKYQPSPRFDREQFYEVHEEKFLDDNLREFYAKHGLL